MEDWEKRFSELEAEVDAEFKKKEKPLEKTGREQPSVPKKKTVKKAENDDDDDSLFDDMAKEVATKAIQKTAEKSLAKMGTNKAIIYSAAAILGLIFVYKNLFFLMFCGGIVGALYYFLEIRPDNDDDDDEEEKTTEELEEDNY